MKKYNSTKYVIALLLGCFTLFIAGCEDDNEGGAPIIERVSLVHKDSTTESGGRGETLAIFGKNFKGVQEVYFSGILAPVNPTMVTNETIIIAIPGAAPFPGPNVLSTVRVVTKFGEAQLEFDIEQPEPLITNFAPAVAAPGATVTITGEFFNGLEGVAFVDAATGEELAAEILSAGVNADGVEQIEVKVPDGVKVSYIAVTTPAGVGMAESTFGFNFAVFTDDVAAGWNKGGWSGTTTWTNNTPVKSGMVSAKHAYTGGWGGFQLSHSTADGSKFLLADYTHVKVSIYGGPGTSGKKVQIYIKELVDGQYPAKELTVVEGQWTDYTVSLIELGSPTFVGELVIQDKGQAPYLMFVDDLGFL